MNKQDILNGLEGLKDLLNTSGKQQVDALKAGVMGLIEEPKKEEIAEPEKIPVTEVPKVKIVHPLKKEIVPHGTSAKRKK